MAKKTALARRRPTSDPDQEKAPWAEELFPQPPNPGFAAAGLLVPRAGREDADRTFAPAASVRFSASTGKRLDVATPARSAAEVHQKHGLLSTRYPQRLSDPKAARVGVFAPFESLGLNAAFFRDEQTLDAVRDDLGDEYEFVPDFPLSLPLRMTNTQFPANKRLTPRAAREWPAEVGVDDAHAVGVLGAGVLVAVLDTGVDADHAEFAGRRTNFRYVSVYPNDPNWPPRDVRGFDTQGHGTHCCGIIAGRSVGVAPEAELYVASVVESESTLTTVTRVAAGLHWVFRQFTRPDNERKPGVLSLSLGFPPDPGVAAAGDATLGHVHPLADYRRRYDTMRLLIRTLRQANVLTVAAIGNDGPGQFGYPAALEDVVAVGAVGFDMQVAPFSGSTPRVARPAKPERPAKPDLVGFGVGVDSATERDYDNVSVYQRMSGTSMATPYVAGIAALYRSEDTSRTPDDVSELLYATAVPVTGPRASVGRGLAAYHPV
jgi:subtilisin family serine protease